MLMILAPSKTQEFRNVLPYPATEPALLGDAELLIEELRKMSVSELGSLMKMSERLARQTADRIVSFELPFSSDNAACAIAVFQGDVYSRIGVERYSRDEISYMQEHLRILSGLYGVLRPLDLMQQYRLEMGCRLPNSRGKNLYEFWGNRVTEELNRVLAGLGEQRVVNLASAEYSRVIKKKALCGKVLQIEFKERKGDTYRTVAIHAKRARGMMVDFAVRNRLENVQQLQEFRESSYRFRPELSSAECFCFTRDSTA